MASNFHHLLFDYHYGLEEVIVAWDGVLRGHVLDRATVSASPKWNAALQLLHAGIDTACLRTRLRG